MITNWMQVGITPSLGAWTGLITGMAGTTTSTGGAGVLTGYSRPGWYNAATPCGSIVTDLFVDRRVPANPKTIRLMGVVKQGSGFIVIGWKLEPGIPPTTAMPSMQGSLKIFGYTLSLASGSRPGVEAGTDGLYWTVASVPMVSGQPFSFEFA